MWCLFSVVIREEQTADTSCDNYCPIQICPTGYNIVEGFCHTSTKFILGQKN